MSSKSSVRLSSAQLSSCNRRIFQASPRGTLKRISTQPKTRRAWVTKKFLIIRYGLSCHMVSMRGCRRGRLFKGSHPAVKARRVRGPDLLVGLLQGGFSRIWKLASLAGVPQDTQIRAMARQSRHVEYDQWQEYETAPRAGNTQC